MPLPLPAVPPSSDPSEVLPQGGDLPEPLAESWRVGDRVSLQGTPRYLKTADPMPMLRPPDLVGIEEVGTVVGLRAFGQLAVKFRRGTFLVDAATVRAERPSAGASGPA